MNYYAAKTENEKHIFESWKECEKFVKGKKGVLYKKFSTLDDAKCFLNECSSNNQNKIIIPTAFIDGSYNSKTGEYSFGCVLIIDSKEFTFSKKYEQDNFSCYRNVAGEIKGAGFIIQYAINHNIKELDLYYDYEGIEKWYNGEWKANSLIARKYVEFKNKVYYNIVIHFHKVKSHTNVKYNDLVDKLAKEALGIK